ncbi:unnamed protein product [Phaeothamnion confervicola]
MASESPLIGNKRKHPSTTGRTASLDVGSASDDNGANQATLQQVISDKRLKRLEKNRESARECRRRKKERTLEVERELARLEADNLALRLQLKIGDEAEELENSRVESIKDKLDSMVNQEVAEGDILSTMEELKEKYADYGRDRTSAAVHHLDHLARLLLPTTTTRVALYAILQDYESRMAAAEASLGVSHVAAAGWNGQPHRIAAKEEPRLAAASREASEAAAAAFAGTATVVAAAGMPGGQAGGGSSSGGGAAAAPELWDLLAAELEVTPEAQEALRSKAHIIMELETELRQLMGHIATLKGLVTNRSRSLDDEMAQIQSILTPTQAAKFVLWVSRNQACMHMLETLWSRVHDGK